MPFVGPIDRLLDERLPRFGSETLVERLESRHEPRNARRRLEAGWNEGVVDADDRLERRQVVRRRSLGIERRNDAGLRIVDQRRHQSGVVGHERFDRRLHHAAGYRGIDRIAAVAQDADHGVRDGRVIAAANGSLVTNDRRRTLIAY